MLRPLPKPVLASVLSFTFLLPLCAGQHASKPLTEAEVIDLLKNDVPSERVEALARQYGIAFEMNDQAESALLVAGASDGLLATLREIAPKPPAEPPTLMIEVTPGGAQVFLDDELFARTSPEGRLKIGTLKPGPHRVRISLDGYRDYEQVFTLEEGKTATASTTLQAVPKAGESTRPGISKADAGGARVSGTSTATRPQRVIIPAGTVVTVRLADDVDSSRDKPGKEFAAEVDAPITVSGQVAIPRDTNAHLRLLSAGIPSQPSLQIQLFTITLNGRDYNVPATVYTKTSEPSRPATNSPGGNARVGGILGAVIGGSAGRAIAGSSRRTNTPPPAPPQTLAKETKIDFTLRGPMLVMQ